MAGRRAERSRTIRAGGLVALVGLVSVMLPSGSALAAPAPGFTFTVDVTGTGGVPADAAAVAVNLTATNTKSDGFLTVYACGGEVPSASNVNYRAGESVGNLAVAEVGPDGTICVYSYSPADVVVDVNGWFAAGSDFTATSPQRVLDTRTGVRLTPGERRVVPVGAAVPDGAGAVIANVTVTEPDADGFLTAFPCGQPEPGTSNLNFRAGDTVPNLVIAALDADAQLCLSASVATHVLVDVAGSLTGTGFTPVGPVRLLDTRTTPGPVAAGTVLEVDAPAGTTAVVWNVTATQANAPGYLSVYPCGTERPETSNVNYGADDTVANLVISGVGENAKVCIYTFAAVEIVVDAFGSFIASGSYTPQRPGRVFDSRTRPGLDDAADVDRSSLGFDGCTPTDAAWGLEPSAQCVWAERPHLDGDKQPDVVALYRAGDPGSVWKTATWTSSRGTTDLIVGALLGADASEHVPYRIDQVVDPVGDHHGGVLIATSFGAAVRDVSWQTALGSAPLAPVVVQGTGADFSTDEAGHVAGFSTTLCTDIDGDGTINVVLVDGGLSSFNQPPYVWDIDATVYQWGSDGTVQRLPAADRTGTVPDDDLGSAPETGPPCQGHDEPGVLALIDV